MTCELKLRSGEVASGLRRMEYKATAATRATPSADRAIPSIGMVLATLTMLGPGWADDHVPGPS